MQGNGTTLHILLVETSGLALADIELVREHAGLSYKEEGMVLIVSNRRKAF